MNTKAVHPRTKRITKPKLPSTRPTGISLLKTKDHAKQPTNGDVKNTPKHSAPNGPGIPARWTSSAKTGLGTALSNQSRVWFTLSHGIFNEIYYPRIDQACIRDLGLIVTDGAKFFSEEKRDAGHKVEWLADGVPAFKLVNTCRDGLYRIEKQIVTDPHRDTVLQQVQFHAQQGALSDYHLHVVLAPHLGNHGGGNTAWVGEFEGMPMLFAQRNDCALALACSAPWTKRSAGYVGSSDGWQDLKAHHQMTWEYTRAENGNVALTAGIDLVKSHGKFALALGFGKDPDEAARNAIASLRDGFDKAKHHYVAGWQEWTKTHVSLKPGEVARSDLAQKSLAVLRTHESKTAPGALIASLAIPWGFSQGDNDQGGYHLVWSRDMVETAGGLLAAGAHEDARRVLAFLQRTQQPDGHWSQNMWLDGSPYWNGIQMDETALPILLVDLARREKALAAGDLEKFWPMVKKAAGYLARNGPVSPQDRWEEDPGYTPFTVAAEIAALLAAAELAELNHEASIAIHLREIADVWNDSIERWMYMSATDWCRKYKVDGYYVRIAPKQTGADGSNRQQNIQVKNVTASEDTRRASHLISPDALALVRFGLRAVDDPRIRDTAKVIDALLKVETPNGATWHRYNDDGYGEHEDGSPFDGTGIGRGWPLLTGERAHFELANGHEAIATTLLSAMESFANESGLISEQVWDSPNIAERELYFGRPSGSAMPLVWAHAEYLKLRRSLRDGRIFDQPPQTVQRYLKEKTVSSRLTWRFNHKLRSLPPGKILRIELMAPAVIHWTADDWKTCQDIKTLDDGLGIHLADLPTKSLSEGAQIKFTFYWSEAGHWEGKDFMVRIATWRREVVVPPERNETDGK
ncbi:MAG TPA: glucan 1,4-alpha-glucosidase [Candidatus Paceibacterota bacterium]|nr:glucan 1,4-alpha-glucosidase [Candidatus Paceibacterota bacterium]